MACLGRCAITADSAWVTVIIAPGAGVNDGVAILPPQVARPRPTLDQVSVGDVLRLVRPRAGLAGVAGTRKRVNRRVAERRRHDNDETPSDQHCRIHDVRPNEVGICRRLRMGRVANRKLQTCKILVGK